MSPATSILLPLLLFAALNSESTAAESENSIGQKFIVVFPENIAYYHPVRSQNKVWITALHHHTSVTIKQFNTELDKGTHSFDINIELRKVDNSNEVIGHSGGSVQITSNKDIVVQAFSARGKSMQTALVIPADKLGKKYFIPPIYKIQRAVSIVNMGGGRNINEKGPFRLIIVNTDEDNTVTVEGAAIKEFSLESNHVAQIRVPDEESLQVVEADKPVAVLFGHPCAIRAPCSCGLMYTTLQPARDEKVKFLIPPALATDPENETFVLLSDQTNRSAEAFTPASAVVETSGTAVLYRPDLLLTLIPEADFASCYVVTKISEEVNIILIVVHKDDKDGIHIGQSPLQDSNPEWQELNGTDYVSGSLSLSDKNVVIWHKSAKMGVYYVGVMNETSFGHPAPIISHTPDHRGCAMTPEVLEIPDVEGSWQKAIATCSSEDAELVSLWEEPRQKYICDKLSQDNGNNGNNGNNGGNGNNGNRNGNGNNGNNGNNGGNGNNPEEVWIGMRRFSATEEWYWLNNAAVQYTNWDEGEPGSMDDGQCVVMSLKKNKDCVWRDEECCNVVRPLCYKDPELLEL